MIDEEKDRPGPLLAIPKQPMAFIITSVFLLNCLHNKFQYATALRALRLLAYSLWGIPTANFENELIFCQKELVANKAKVTWWLNETGLHYDYRTKHDG